MDTSSVLIAWAIVGGKRRHISDCADLPLHTRPQAHCEVCEHKLTMKIGHKNAPHYAHQPDTVCVLTAPETALHYNSKSYLASQLEGQGRLFVIQKCEV